MGPWRLKFVVARVLANCTPGVRGKPSFRSGWDTVLWVSAGAGVEAGGEVVGISSGFIFHFRLRGSQAGADGGALLLPSRLTSLPVVADHPALAASMTDV